MRQLIIARKDLGMSAGKLSAQVAHASMAYFTELIRTHSKKVMDSQFQKMRVYMPGYPYKKMVSYRHADLYNWCFEAAVQGKDYFYVRKYFKNDSEWCQYELVDKKDITYHYESTVKFDSDIYEDWISSIFTKTVCEARNKNHLMKSIAIAQDLGLAEGRDFFLIKDNCLTELEPEEVGADGIGRTLTCIGFRPLPDEVAHEISRKYQLFK